jgi:chromosome segregation ATPase
MQSKSTNGSANSAREMLDSVRQTIEKLETELGQQRKEIEALRAERDEYRKMLTDQVKHLFGGPEAWDDFDEKDYKLTIDDLLAVINSK